MIANPKLFFRGVALMAGFVIVLVAMFLPIFDGYNTLEYMDSLFNSVSKGSAYHVADLKTEAEGHRGNAIAVTLALASGTQAGQLAELFRSCSGREEPPLSSRKRSFGSAAIWEGFSTAVCKIRTSCSPTREPASETGTATRRGESCSTGGPR
jgi:hypothetical protein